MGINVQTHIGRRTVDLTPTEFFHLAYQLPQPSVEVSLNSVGQYCYMVQYRGLTFQTQSQRKIQLPSDNSITRAMEMVLPHIRVERMPPLQL